MTAQEKINELQGKISTSTTLISEFNAALKGPTGWIQYKLDWCKSLENNPYHTQQNVDNCNEGTKKVQYYEARIVQEEANIVLWNGEIDALQKDPTIIIAMNEAEDDAKWKKILRYTLLAIIIISALGFIWWKWIRK